MIRDIGRVHITRISREKDERKVEKTRVTFKNRENDLVEEKNDNVLIEEEEEEENTEKVWK